MLGRIMVGKIPNDVRPDHVNAVLSSIPLPRIDVKPAENCVSWTVAALQELRGRGWVDSFDLQSFMNYASDRASYWCRDNYYLGKNLKENYTGRKFP
ncbi:hypothetical protein ANO14919_116550 [Xylariales sp. No.14919]|nr:hypothetical protein ANO14919_116550 [Xylariales sp. No.14919]